MFTRSTNALAMMLGAATTALAATKHCAAPLHNVYNPRGVYVGPDPDLNVPFALWGEYECGRKSLPPEVTSGQPTTGRF
jgi:hypothetical protein